MTRVVKVDPDQPEPEVIAEAAAVIRRGGLVAFPTETVAASARRRSMRRRWRDLRGQGPSGDGSADRAPRASDS